MGGREASVISASRVGEKERKRHMMASAFEICREVDICLKKYAPTSPRFLFVPEQTRLISLFNKTRDLRAQPPVDSMDIGQKRRPLVRHLERFNAVSLRFNAVSLRFKAVSLRFNAVSLRFNAVSLRFNDVSLRFNAVSLEFDDESISSYAVHLRKKPVRCFITSIRFCIISVQCCFTSLLYTYLCHGK